MKHKLYIFAQKNETFLSSIMLMYLAFYVSLNFRAVGEMLQHKTGLNLYLGILLMLGIYLLGIKNLFFQAISEVLLTLAVAWVFFSGDWSVISRYVLLSTLVVTGLKYFLILVSHLYWIWDTKKYYN